VSILLALSTVVTGGEAIPSPATRPAGEAPDGVGEWIEQLGSEQAEVREAARRKLLANPGKAFRPLLRARAVVEAEHLQRVEDVLDVLRARICLRVARDAMRREISKARKAVAGLQEGRDDEDIRRTQERIETLRRLAARYAKMSPEQYELPEPLHLEGHWEGGPMVAWSVGGVRVWRPGKGPTPMHYVGMSRSGPFYRVLAAATPLPKADRLPVAVYPLLQVSYRFPVHVVYAERRDYPEYASAAQRIDHLLTMPKRFGAWQVVAEELVKLARTGADARALVKERALPVLREAVETEHLAQPIRERIRQAIRAIEGGPEPATRRAP
jgi:hypothetical protein